MSKQSDDPQCCGCPQKGACEAFDYYDACIVRKKGTFAYMEDTDAVLDRKCINCKFFRPFEGACDLHPGSRENEDYCSNYKQYRDVSE